MSTFRQFIAVLFVALVASEAHAGRMWIATNGTHHADALSACEATANPNFEIRVLSIQALSGGRYRAICSYKTGGLSSYNVSTTGECFEGRIPLVPTPSESALCGCPAGTEFDSASQQCVEPPSKDCPTGDLFPARGSESPIVVGGDGLRIVASQPPSNVCFGSCVYSGTAGETRSSGCYVSASDPGMGYCNYVIKSTGESCSAESYQLALAGQPLNPPPDPNEPPEPPPPTCPAGWGVQGNTCYKLPPKPCDPSTGEICNGNGGNDGGNDGGNTGGGGGGGGGSGGNDGGSGGNNGGDGGDGGTGGSGGIGGIGGGDSGSGGEPGTGEGDGLFRPTQGTFDGYISDADEVIDGYRDKLSAISDKYQGLIDSKLNISLATAGGGLPCWSFNALGKNHQICLSKYESEAVALRNVILLLAAIAALFIVFRGSD